MTSTWILIAATNEQSHLAQTTVTDPRLLYRAASKWVVRGGASHILESFWEYIDQNDNELEEALLDQLLTQAETKPQDPQITNVRTKDYSIDMMVHTQTVNNFYKTCKIDCTLYVYLTSLSKKVKIDRQIIDLTLFKSTGRVEKIVVDTLEKTPMEEMKPNKRVSKRSSLELSKKTRQKV